MAYCVVHRKEFSDTENCPWCREVTPPKPAHIDTTAPEVIRAEDQVRPFDLNHIGEMEAADCEGCGDQNCPCNIDEEKDQMNCEMCSSAPMICLNGQRWLCWEHYCEVMKPAPTPSPIDTTGKEKIKLTPLEMAAVYGSGMNMYWAAKRVFDMFTGGYNPTEAQLNALAGCLQGFEYHWTPSPGDESAPASIATTQGDAEPCIDCCEPGSTKETIEEQKIPYGQTGVVLTAYVPVFTCTKCGMQWTDWRGEGIREKVVAAYLAQPKPAPQAEARESLPAEPKMLNGNEEITWDMLWIDRKKWIDYARKVVDAWNAQQAKIEALEQRVVELENLFGLPDENDPLCARLVNSGTFDPEVQRARSGGSIGDWMRRAETAEARVSELEEKLREGK